GLSWAVRPVLEGTTSAVRAVAWTAGFAADRADAISASGPGTAKLTAVVLIVTACDAPAASVTWLWPRVAAIAAGPPSVSEYVSAGAPVSFTVNGKLSPGAAEPRPSVSCTPPATTVNVPLAVVATAGSPADVAVTVKG